MQILTEITERKNQIKSNREATGLKILIVSQAQKSAGRSSDSS